MGGGNRKIAALLCFRGCLYTFELAQHVGVSHKTPWFMDHRLRKAVEQGDNKLFGTVEVNEIYVGGKHIRKNGFGKKAPVFSMTERGGNKRWTHTDIDTNFVESFWALFKRGYRGREGDQKEGGTSLG